MINKKTIEQCKALLAEADVVLIGAGAGLSTAAGLHYGGQRFQDHFPDFIAEYQLTDMYSSAFYPFKTQEEFWAYFSRHIKLNRYDTPAFDLYKNLFDVVKGKDYFVITTNADAQFFKSGFAEQRIFATQGDYALFQCETACHDTLYDNKEVVEKMVHQQDNFRIPSELIPVCPHCGGPMTTHLRKDNYFVENADWHKAAKRYADFVKNANGKKLLLLELGIGFNTPGIIRFPFEQFLSQYTESHLIRVNMEDVNPYYKIPQDRATLLKEDIAEFVNNIQGL